MVGRIARAAGALSAAGMALSALALVLMTLLITIEVIGRNFFSVSTLVSDEMAGYLLVALTFLGLAATLRQGGLIRVDVYRRRLRGRGRRVLDVILYVLASVYTAVLVWYAWRFVLESYRFKTTSIYFTATPLWIPHGLMALGASLLLLELLAALCVTVAGEGLATAEEAAEG